MNVISAIPLQIPVHRVRASIRCRGLGTPLHTTVRRIANFTQDEQLIAAATGLSLKNVARVRAELAHELPPIEREYLIWVDHARQRCLPYTALDGVVAICSKDAGLTLPLDAPTAPSLTRMGLSAAASWNSGIEGQVEIIEVLNVVADARGSDPSGKRSLAHVLRLPDVHLLVCFEKGRPYEPRIVLTQHAIDNLELTRWLHEQYGPSLTSDILDLRHVTEARALPPQWLIDLIGRSEPDSTAKPWALIEPHPNRIRKALSEVIEAATDRLDVCAPSVRELPEWLRKALAGARERDVSVVISPAQTEDQAPPSRRPALGAARPARRAVRDRGHDCAAIHTDPIACLDRGKEDAPRPQHLALTHAKPAVLALPELLSLAPPRQRKELDRINALAQEHRAQAGELGPGRAELPSRPYALAAGDQVIFTVPFRQPGAPRVENGTLGRVESVDGQSEIAVQTRGANEQNVHVDTTEFHDMRLAYAQHVYKAQGATVDRAFVLTGGWQTDRERAYVALSRARERTDIYVSREDLGEQGMEAGAIERLGEQISESHAKQASINTPLAHQRDPAPAIGLAPGLDQQPPGGLGPDAGADPPHPALASGQRRKMILPVLPDPHSARNARARWGASCVSGRRSSMIATAGPASATASSSVGAGRRRGPTQATAPHA